jgi:hypothetical protein
LNEVELGAVWGALPKAIQSVCWNAAFSNRAMPGNRDQRLLNLALACDIVAGHRGLFLTVRRVTKNKRAGLGRVRLEKIKLSAYSYHLNLADN